MLFYSININSWEILLSPCQRSHQSYATRVCSKASTGQLKQFVLSLSLPSQFSELVTCGTHFWHVFVVAKTRLGHCTWKNSKKCQNLHFVRLLKRSVFYIREMAVVSENHAPLQATPLQPTDCEVLLGTKATGRRVSHNHREYLNWSIYKNDRVASSTRCEVLLFSFELSSVYQLSNSKYLLEHYSKLPRSILHTVNR